MDSGTVNKLSAIHYVLSIPDDILIKNTNFDSLQYSDKTSSILDQLFDHKIYITSIIVDNLKCQTKGLETMKDTSENPLIKSIYIIHCFCHMTSLVFVNTMNQNSHLAQLVNSIKQIVSLLRKSEVKAFIGKQCPTICRNSVVIYI